LVSKFSEIAYRYYLLVVDGMNVTLKRVSTNPVSKFSEIAYRYYLLVVDGMNVTLKRVSTNPLMCELLILR